MVMFSVIIPLYNGEKTITDTLNSVLSQTYQDYEIILVNDDSPDNVGEVVSQFINQHPHVKFKYVEQKNKGLGGARNTAIKNAEGAIIALLDQDDIWYPEKLASVVKIYETRPEVSLVSHNLNVRKNGRIIETRINGPARKDMHRALLLSGNCISTPAATFKREIIKKIGYFMEDKEKYHLVEDYEFWMRMALAGYKFYFLSDILGEYSVHAQNYSTSQYKRMFVSKMNVITLHYGLRKHKKPLDYLKLRERRANLCFELAYQFFNSHLYYRSLFYLIRSIIYNPLYVFVIAGKMFKRMYKLGRHYGDVVFSSHAR